MGQSLKAHWARENQRRKELPENEVRHLAARQIERRLGWGKTGDKKPRLRVFDQPRGRIRFVLYAGRYFIRATTWERLVYRAAFGPWSKTPTQFVKRKAPRPPCTKPTATIRHGRCGTPMLLVGVKRDELGRVLSGWVDNGAWQLVADHEQQVFWSEEYPNRKTSMANFNGWDR